jgi:tRNA pseudouridine38-40 synthase
VRKDADARFDAKARTYQYFIHQKRNPFLVNRSYYYYGELDIVKMNQCAKILKKYNDFSAFSKVHKQTKTNVCKIFEAKWEILEKRNLPRWITNFCFCVASKMYYPTGQAKNTKRRPDIAVLGAWGLGLGTCGSGLQLVFTIRANRFLRGMVRMIVGTMLLVGKHKITVNDFKKILESKDCKNAGPMVPACGLYLTKVEY